MGRMIEAVHGAAPLPRRGGRAGPARACAARLVADGYEELPTTSRRLARVRVVDGRRRRRVAAGRRSRAARSQVLPSDAFDPGRRERAASRSAQRAARRRSSAPRGSSRTSSSSRRRRPEVVEAERAKLERVPRGAGASSSRELPRRPRSTCSSLELFGMRFGLDRMHRLMTVLGLPQRRFASIHVVGSNGKSSTVRLRGDPRAARRCDRQLHVAAPALVPERIEVGEVPVSRPTSPPRSRARRRRRRWWTARRRGRPRDPVRGAHRRGVLGAGAARGGGGGDRGGARRPLRRDQRDPVEGAGADLGGPRAHALARADAHGHRRREAGGGARPGTLVWARCRTRSSRSRRGWPPTVTHAGARRSPTGAAARLGPASSERTSRSRRRRRRRSWGGRSSRAALRRAAAETRVPGRLEAVARASARRCTTARTTPRARRAGGSLPDVFGRAPAAGGRDRGPRGQGRGGDAARAAAARSTGWCFTRPAQPALAARRRRCVRLAEKVARAARRGGGRPAGGARRARELAGPEGAVLATGSIYLIADLVREDAGARASTCSACARSSRRPVRSRWGARRVAGGHGAGVDVVGPRQRHR